MDDDMDDDDENSRLLSTMDDDKIVKDKTPFINLMSVRIVFVLTLTMIILIGSNRCNAKHDIQNYNLIEYIAQISITISIDLQATKYFGSMYK